MGVMTYRRSKTRHPAHVPGTCPVPSYAMGMLPDRDLIHQASTQARHGYRLLATATGEFRSSKALGNLIRAAALDAGLTGLSAHG
jgi:integrase/recombinase XerD